MSNVEIRTVEITDRVRAEAGRDRRAKIIHAEVEFQASQTHVNAAWTLGSTPATMQLRYVQTLTEIGASTIVFPKPIDIIKSLLDLLGKSGKPIVPNGDRRIPLTREAQLAA